MKFTFYIIASALLFFSVMAAPFAELSTPLQPIYDAGTTASISSMGIDITGSSAYHCYLYNSSCYCFL